MTTSFPTFARLVARDFQAIANSGSAFVSSVTGDDLYEAYLGAFPPGTDPIFKKKTEHDCSSCRGFIRRAGNVVGVTPEGRVTTVWDRAATDAPAPYNTVAAALRDRLVSAPLADLFRVGLKETSFGSVNSRSQDPVTLKVYTWDHLHTGTIPAALRVASPGAVCGEFRTTVEVFERGLNELTPRALETVRELIAANNLYRGHEHMSSVKRFQDAQREYLKLGVLERQRYVWARAADPSARFKNTVIGTLVADLSEGVDLEKAVRSFESKVAPQNYKRTTALITPGMVEAAMKTITELGLEPSLERRLANLGDVTVRDMLWVDSSVKPLMKGGIAAALMAAARTGVAAEVEESRAEEITLDDFMARVAPGALGLELLFKNENLGNLMVLTAPLHPEPRQLFRWSNDFAWSYVGQVADSIRERVKKAGGRVEGARLRVSLSWSNYDDLDIHVFEPAGRGTAAVGGRIYYGAKRGWTGGVLDVDMNAGAGTTREPVENVVWAEAVPDGAYKVMVNNYNQRETSNPGFTVEVECGGKLTHYTYNKVVRQKQEVAVCTLRMKGGVIESVEGVDPGISSAAIKQTKWGLTTGQFVKVSAITSSPNYWGGDAVGNRHTFFVVDGCACDEEVRGFYNEFLHPRLEPHRRVFEVIGEKTKVAPSADQIAGLGFSSTKKDSFVMRVRTAKGVRTYNVQVG